MTEFSNNMVEQLMIHNGTEQHVQLAQERTLETTTECPLPRIQVWALMARPSIVVCSRFGIEAAPQPLSQGYMIQ